MSLVKWFMIQIERLPKYTDEETQSWAVFEAELRTAWGKTSLNQFPLALQKQAIIGRMQGEASKIHSLISEGSWAWTVGISTELFLNHTRDLVKAPQKETLARLTFEQIVQLPKEPILWYHDRKKKALHGAMTRKITKAFDAGVFEYFKHRTIKGILSEKIRERVTNVPARNYACLKQKMIQAEKAEANSTKGFFFQYQETVDDTEVEVCWERLGQKEAKCKKPQSNRAIQGNPQKEMWILRPPGPYGT